MPNASCTCVGKHKHIRNIQSTITEDTIMLTKEQITQAKGRGFLLNRGTELFSGRIVCPGAVYTADEVALISECAQRYGNGKVAFTVRMAAEIPGMAYENLDAAEEFLSSRSQLTFGGTGARVRPIVACKGTTCIYGNADTQALARKIYGTTTSDAVTASCRTSSRLASAAAPTAASSPA